jgi:competence protein ComFC
MARRPDGHFLCHDSQYLLAPASRFFPPIPKLIHSFKYSGLYKIEVLLSGILIAYLQRCEINIGEYTVTFIPLHKSKQRNRGFNQAQVLAQNVADYFSAECLPLLERIVNNKQQAKISDRQKRKENISGCFQSFNTDKIAGKNILLVDDVSTSGATLNEAVNILKKYGARKIICLVVARA